MRFSDVRPHNARWRLHQGDGDASRPEGGLEAICDNKVRVPSQQSADRKAPIFFLVGAERSGTTMLGLMLGNHPKIAWKGEHDFLTSYLLGDPSSADVRTYIDRLRADRRFVATGYDLRAGLSYIELLHSFLEDAVKNERRQHVGVTVHVGFHHLPRIWPDACFINLLRDGRDVSRSCIGLGWAGNMWHAGDRWLRACSEWEKLCDLVPSERRLQVRYEDLVTSPRSVLAGVSNFIGVHYSETMMEYPARSTYSKPDPTLCSQWKHRLTRGQIRLSEARIGDVLVRQGYTLSGEEPFLPSAVHRLYFRAQNRWATVRFRIRRYGWWLVCSKAIARRLRWRSWEHASKLRMNAIDSRYLK